MRTTCCGRRRRSLPYLVLLQVGFAVPPGVAAGAVRSYRTISPLPAPLARRLGGIFLLHFPWTRAPQALPGTVSCGARTFLHLGPACAVLGSGCLADSWRADYPSLSASARLYASLSRDRDDLRCKMSRLPQGQLLEQWLEHTIERTGVAVVAQRHGLRHGAGDHSTISPRVRSASARARSWSSASDPR